MANKQLLAAMHEPAKVAQMRADLKMDDDRETYELKGPNPSMKMTIAPGGHAAQMQVKTNNRLVASMEYFEDTEDFIFSLFDKGTGVVKSTFEIKKDGHAYVNSKKVVVQGELERPSVISTYSPTPTKAELVAAAKLLPNYSNDVAFWGAGHDFYVHDAPQTTLLLVKYRGLPANVDEASAGNFFYELMTKAA